MKHLFLVSIKFYNGLLGVYSRKIWQLRGVADAFERIPPIQEVTKKPSSTSKTPPMVKYYYENVLANQNITAKTNVAWVGEITR